MQSVCTSVLLFLKQCVILPNFVIILPNFVIVNCFSHQHQHLQNAQQFTIPFCICPFTTAKFRLKKMGFTLCHDHGPIYQGRVNWHHPAFEVFMYIGISPSDTPEQGDSYLLQSTGVLSEVEVLMITMCLWLYSTMSSTARIKET